MTARGHESEEAAYDARLTYLVDTLPTDYDYARRIVGPPPYEIVDTQETPRASVVPSRQLGSSAVEKVIGQPLPRRSRSGHGPQFGEEEGVGYPGGEPPYYSPDAQLSEEQTEINRRGMALVKKTLEDAKANRSQQ